MKMKIKMKMKNLQLKNNKNIFIIILTIAIISLLIIALIIYPNIIYIYLISLLEISVENIFTVIHCDSIDSSKNDLNGTDNNVSSSSHLENNNISDNNKTIINESKSSDKESVDFDSTINPRHNRYRSSDSYSNMFTIPENLTTRNEIKSYLDGLNSPNRSINLPINETNPINSSLNDIEEITRNESINTGTNVGNDSLNNSDSIIKKGSQSFEQKGSDELRKSLSVGDLAQHYDVEKPIEFKPFQRFKNFLSNLRKK